MVMIVALTAAPTLGETPPESAKVDAQSWRFHDIVSVDFVKQQIKFPMPADAMIIDSRPKRAKYDKGHIPMAVNIPDRKFDEMTELLPADKNALLIFYCGGQKCKLSHKSAKKAEKLGYTNVKVFADGFPGWMKVAGHYACVSENYVKKQLDAGNDTVVIDSRPKRKKYDKGHIASAMSIPDSQFDKMTDQLPVDKDTQLVFYCGGYKCKLSHKSAAKAIALGYSKVKVFAAGFPAWKKAGYPIETAEVKMAGAAIKAGTEEGSIDIENFEKIINEKPDSIMLIDVRDKDEFQESGSIKTAVNMPVDEVEEKIKTLPADKPIVFICGTGARSGECYYMVKDMRNDIKDVYYIEAEMTFNKDGTYKIVKPS